MIGFHLTVSNSDISDLFKRMKFIGCKTSQIYLGNPRSMKKNIYNKNIITTYKEQIKKNNYSIYVHASYGYNLLNSKNTNISIIKTINDIKHMDKMGMLGYVVHIGSTTNKNRVIIDGYIVKNLLKIVQKLRDGKCKILIENQPREGNKYLSNVSDIINLWNEIKKYPKLVKRVAFCIDLCHLYTELNSIKISNKVKQKNIIKSIVRLTDKVPVELIHLNNIITPHRDVHAMPLDPLGLILPSVIEELMVYFRIKNINMIIEMSKLYSNAKNKSDKKNVLISWKKFISDSFIRFS